SPSGQDHCYHAEQPGFDVPSVHFIYFRIIMLKYKSPTSVTEEKGREMHLYILCPLHEMYC
ncbi:unnamed protein product, partial [Brassica oleracea var. botrytis]